MSPRTISAKESGRLDRVLRSTLDSSLAKKLSRKSWDFLFDNGLIRNVDAKRYRAGDTINKGDLITLLFPSDKLGLLPNSEIPVEVIAGSIGQDWIVFNKPMGVPTYSHFPWDHASFANGICAYLEKQNFMHFESLAESPFLEGGLVQRLDRDTSGLLLCALSKSNKGLFKKWIIEKKVEKKYLATVHGNCADGIKKLFLSASGAKKMKATEFKNEDSDIEVTIQIKKLSSGNNATLLEISTRDGARHVVRASMAALGFPLVGDKLYGGENIFEINYHQLHAAMIKIDNASFLELKNGVFAPPPKEFLDNLQKLELNYSYAK